MKVFVGTVLAECGNSTPSEKCQLWDSAIIKVLLSVCQCHGISRCKSPGDQKNERWALDRDNNKHECSGDEACITLNFEMLATA